MSGISKIGLEILVLGKSVQIFEVFEVFYKKWSVNPLPTHWVTKTQADFQTAAIYIIVLSV